MNDASSVYCTAQHMSTAGAVILISMFATVTSGRFTLPMFLAKTSCQWMAEQRLPTQSLKKSWTLQTIQWVDENGGRCV